MTKLKKLLKNKLEQINEIPAINSGGCAFVALELAKHITKLGYKAEIVYLFGDYDEKGFNNVKNMVADSCLHAVVQVDDVYFDSTGPMKIGKLKREWDFKYKAVLTKKFTTQTLISACWNPFFDRKNIKTIRTILKG